MPASLQTRGLFCLVAIAIISLGFIQPAGAAVVGTQEMIDAENRQDRISQIERVIARDDVARQLEKFGVAPEFVSQRLDTMTDAELIELEASMEQATTGGDAVGILGVVFLVLLVLELVGVTDIFKKI